MDIAQIIYDGWLELRAKRCLEEVLPSARAYKTVSNDGSVDGYDTCDYQVHRRVSIPGSGPTGGKGIAGLVEIYFSVRHHNGWGHNLHVHVVEARNEMLQVSHLAQLFRHVAAVRVGLAENQVTPKSSAFGWMHRHVYVHGALLGPSASADVLMAETMINTLDENYLFVQPMIRVGCVTVHRDKSVSVKHIEPESNYSVDWRGQAEGAQLKEVLAKLLESSGSPMWPEWVTARQIEENQLVRNRAQPKTGLEQGEINGRRQVLSRLLMKRFDLADRDRAQIEDCADAATLDRWIDNVFGAKTIEDVFSAK